MTISESSHVYHIKDDSPHGNFGWAEKIWIPVALGLVGVAATGIGTFFGFKISELQQTNAEAKRIISRASQASSARQSVLTEYATRVTDLVSENDLMLNDPNDPDKEHVWHAIRGESIIALKRLDDIRSDDGKGEIDLLQSQMDGIFEGQSTNFHLPFSTSTGNSQETQLKEELEGFNDSGRLKGELVRFLHASELLNAFSAEGPDASLLSGADLNKVVLNDAPLSETTLKRAWMRWGQFRNAGLQRSDFRGADLYEADFQNARLDGINLGWTNLQNTNLRNANLRNANLRDADLRGADLTGADLTGADLTGACYNKGTQGIGEIDRIELGMRDTTSQPASIVCSDLPRPACVNVVCTAP